MNRILKLIYVLALLFGVSAGAFAQGGSKVSLTLRDASSGEPVSFATVSLTVSGAKKPSAYGLTSDSGKAELTKVKAGTYVLKAELMGYIAVTKTISIKGETDLGVIEMKEDTQMLSAASVSAAGNQVIIKKDTIEYNASSFKTTDNDVLEDLLKKLPGIEVSEDGSITVNGETIKKITIDGKTFFLDDPQLASKNIPAKIINKLKVIDKKSEQAEFTGIDDGEEEKVIDLSIKPGMMKGVFGNVMGGVGHDVPSTNVEGDYRYQGAAFAGKFTDKSQISFIFNANNTNNRGFNDLSGSMMGNMRGGGGGMGRGQGGWGNSNGITTSYMGGVNGVFDLFDDKMQLGGNYLYNYTDKNVTELSDKTTYLENSNLLYNSDGSSSTISGGHRMGVRLEHKFSDNTSIIFEPQVNWGTGNYNQRSTYSTYTDNLDGSAAVLTNDGNSINQGNNRNVSTSGFFLLRQRLGIPGRTLTVMSRYSFSDNDLSGMNKSVTNIYGTSSSTNIDQTFDSNEHSSSIWARLTYTEPIGKNFYMEANYSYRWAKSVSNKDTFDNILGQTDYTYCNEIINKSVSQTIGANLMYQSTKGRFQVGASAIPTQTYNSTTQWNSALNDYVPQEYNPGTIWKFSPQAMAWWDFSDNANGRLFYRGTSNQPSTSKLMPVPDVTDPLNISFGNMSLNPYFSHSLRSEYRFNNKKSFTSFSASLEGGYTENPIVNATWYNNGAQYSMPFNGPSSANLSLGTFFNTTINKSKFSVSNSLRASWSTSGNYVGSGVDMTKYSDPTTDYYSFMTEFLNDYRDIESASEFAVNKIQTVTAHERIRLTYRSDALELTASGRTRVNKSWYSLSTLSDQTMTFNNQLRFGANWTWDLAGLTFKSECNYNWYRGYQNPQDDEFVLDAELQKLLFKKKVTLALKGYDILGQAKNLSVSDNANYHQETVNNTLGRYIILSLTYRFGTFDRSKMRGPGGPGGPGGPRGPR